MSTETLRRAAALMRERAEAVHAPKFGDGVEEWESEWLVSAGFDVTDADHIASWPPDVALAVADWLDALAAQVRPNEWDKPPFNRSPGLTVARAYLRETVS